jgi:6-phosphogluconate dehydrogenase
MIEPILTKCAAQVGEPPEACTGYCGPIGAGNYVKMVHNGIEYGDMQLIGEVYDLLKVCKDYGQWIFAPLHIFCEMPELIYLLHFGMCRTSLV